MTKHTPLINPQFQPVSILRAIWKNRLLAAVVIVVVTGAGWWYIHQIPSMYRAEAVIMVDGQKIPEQFVKTTVGGGPQDRLTAIGRQILSAERLRKLIADTGMIPDLRGRPVPDSAVESMSRSISITLDRGNFGTNGVTAFRVAYANNSPQRAAEITNRLAAFFIEDNLKAREIQAEGTAEFVDSQLQEAKKRLDELETQITRFKVAHSSELPQQQVALVGSLGGMQAQLQATSDAITRARQNKTVLESNLEMAEAYLSGLISAWREANQQHQPAQAAPAAPGQKRLPRQLPQFRPNPEIARLEVELEGLRLRYSEEHPDVKRTAVRLQKLTEVEEDRERQFRQAAQAVKPEEQAPVGATPEPAAAAAARAPVLTVTAAEPPELVQARSRVQAIKNQIVAADQELEARNTQEARLRQNMNSTQARIERLPIRDQEMARLSLHYEMAKANYQGLLGKKMNADMATDLERRQKAEKFMIVDHAQLPRQPFYPKRQPLYGLVLAAGLALGLAAAFGNELRHGFVLGEWELPPNTVILGSLPRIKPPSGDRPGGLFGRLPSALMRPAGLAIFGLMLIGIVIAIRIRG